MAGGLLKFKASLGYMSWHSLKKTVNKDLFVFSKFKKKIHLIETSIPSKK